MLSTSSDSFSTENPYYLHYLVKNVRFMFEGNDQLNDLGQEVENRIQEILYVDQNKTLVRTYLSTLKLWIHGLNPLQDI